MTTLLNPDGPIATVADLNAALALAAQQTSGAYAIDLAPGARIALSSALAAIDLQPGVTLSIEGNGATLDGRDNLLGTSYNQRGFFVYSGDVTIANLTIANTVAIGGTSFQGGGGGAGLGGGLFVAANTAGGVAPGHVTLDNVDFTGTSAVGGAGGGNGSGGGGGLGNVGSFGTTTQPDPNPFSSGPITVENPAPGAGAGGDIGTPGVGGGIGGQASTDGATGGTGGFGGGGGGGSGGISTGGNGGQGGFGGGGGGAGHTLVAAGYQGGDGGFGGGGGSTPFSTNGATTVGGFGGGDGFSGASGGGLAAGGDVFVQDGATLVVRGGTLGDGSLSAGSYGGSAYGSALFIQGDTPVVLAPDAGDTLTVAGSIADQTGSGGTGANAGAGSLNLEGQGTVVLSAANTFSGGIHLDHGTLDLGLNASAGGGAITFGSVSEIQTLQLDQGVPAGTSGFANPIANLGLGDVIDLAGLAYRAGTTTATYANGTLTASNGLASESFTLTSPSTTSFTVEHDAGTGTRIVSGTAPTITGLSATAAVNPGDTSYRPFANVRIDDSLASAPTVSVRITINDVSYRTGGLADGAGFSGLSARSYDPTTGFSTYTLQGTAANLSAELNALTFSAGAGTFAHTNAITFNLKADTSISTLRQFGTTSVNIAPTTVASNVADAATLSADILAVSRESQTNGGHGTHYEINLAPGATLNETADLNAINLAGSDSLTINGHGATLDGNSAYRGLFAYSGTLAVNDLTITHMQARGGDGGDSASGGAGGGGAGLGGGLFVASAAHVSLSNVDFAGNVAFGGSGGSGNGTLGGAGGGGGGLGGAGGVGAGLNLVIVDKQADPNAGSGLQTGSGGGSSSGGGTSTPSQPGFADSYYDNGGLGVGLNLEGDSSSVYVGKIFKNFDGNGTNIRVTSLDGTTQFNGKVVNFEFIILNPGTVSIPVNTDKGPGYYGVGGGGGIGSTASGGAHGVAAGDGIVQSTDWAGHLGDGGYAGDSSPGGGGGIAPNGVNGGFGGGGAGGDFVVGTLPAPVGERSGGNGGFGGGGGGGVGGNGTAGNGGFGGGGGGGHGIGGFGGGGGGVASSPAGGTPGGGGLGAGGDIFVQHGGSLTITDGSLSGSAAIGGAAAAGASRGLGFGSGIFIQGGQTITLAPDTGRTLTISDSIADQPGSIIGYTKDGAGSVLIAGSGVVALEAANYYAGTTTVRSGTLLVDGALSKYAGLTEVQNGATLGGHGTLRAVQIDAGGTFSPGNSPGQITVASLTLDTGAHYKEEIGGTTAGAGYDQTVVQTGGTVSLDGATLDLTAYQNFTPSLGDIYKIIDNQATSAISGTFHDAQGHNLGEGSTLTVNGVHMAISYHGGDGNDVTLTAVACYVTGTLILTARGEVPVEALRVGDLAVTASGAHRPVRWIGHRLTDIARHPRPETVLPVRIRAGAVAPGVPARDLLVSPGHAVAIDGVLVKAGRLVNGATIVREDMPRVTYWHVELDSHDLLIADGMAAESYVDCGNRHAFDNGGPVVALHPAFDALNAHAGQSCLPLIDAGPALAAIREALIARAGASFSADPALRLLADGVALAPVSVEGRRYRFRVPEGVRSLRLVSRRAVPREVHAASSDRRRLGIALRDLVVDGAAINPEALGEGWHKGAGRDHRWSEGDAALPLGRAIAFTLCALERYPVAHAAPSFVAA